MGLLEARGARSDASKSTVWWSVGASASNVNFGCSPSGGTTTPGRDETDSRETRVEAVAEIDPDAA